MEKRQISCMAVVKRQNDLIHAEQLAQRINTVSTGGKKVSTGGKKCQLGKKINKIAKILKVISHV